MIPRMNSSIPGFILALAALWASLPSGVSLFENSKIGAGFSLVALSLVVRLLLWIGPGRRFLKASPAEYKKHEWLLGLISSALIPGQFFWMLLSFGVLEVAGTTFNLLRLVVYLILAGIGTIGAPTVALRPWLIVSYLVPVILIPPLYDAFYLGTDLGYLPHLYVFYCAYLIVFSIRAHRTTSEALRDSFATFDRAEYYRGVIESIPGIVTIVDPSIGYQMVNAQFTEFFGLRESEVVGRPVGFLREDGFTTLISEFSRTSLFRLQERRLLKGFSSSEWFLVNLSRMPGGEVLAVSFNIQDQVDAERGEIEQREKAESAARLAAVGEIAAGVAHEINNPLMVIVSKAEQMIAKRGSDPEIVTAMEKIRDMGFRIARIAKSMKALSRDGTKDGFGPVKVEEIFDDVAAIFEERFKVMGIRLERIVPKNLQVTGKGPLLSQVLLNLVGNAFDAIRESGEGSVTLRAEQRGDRVEISVIDSGPGIPPEIRTKIMAPFFTTKPVGKGTGLGLSISRRIATEHGGQLFLDEKSAATRFVLDLPLNEHSTQ